MPRPVDRHETVDLHADWWSPAKDEHGRWKERWVVPAKMSEQNSQNISQMLRTSLKVSMGTERSSTGAGIGKGPQSAEVVSNELPFARLAVLLEMTCQVTDEEGHILVNSRASREFISSLPTYDTMWVCDQLDALYAAPILEPTEDDEAKARMLAEKADYDGTPIPDEANPAAQAVLSFRKTGKAPIQRR